MTTYKDEAARGAFMGNYSKMVLKKNGQVGVFACTLVDDAYHVGSTLTRAMNVRIRLKHRRYYDCFACGASCSEPDIRKVLSIDILAS